MPLASESTRVAVIGAGSWGTTIAAVLAGSRQVVVWARRAELADEINARHTNSDYLEGFTLPAELRATAELGEAIAGAEVIVMAVPSHGYRAVCADVAEVAADGVPIVSLVKGLEPGSGLRMSQVTAEVAPGHPIAVLTGPNLAKEILAGQPAASVIAIDDPLAEYLQDVFSAPALRIYTNPDVIGCELGGVLKNVMAIASGIIEGLGFGANTRATLITRGLAEMTRLGVELGGRSETFAGLAGMGDLIATCSSPQSRNNQVGLQLGQGRTIAEVLASTKMVAEGVKTSPSVLALGRRYGVDMPLTEQVVAVCHEGRSVTDALDALMHRRSKSELG